MISYAEASEPIALKWYWCLHQGLITAICPALELTLEAEDEPKLLLAIQTAVPAALTELRNTGAWMQSLTERKVCGAHAEEMLERWEMRREIPYVLLNEVSIEEFLQL
jgi:hypothetical protein